MVSETVLSGINTVSKAALSGPALHALSDELLAKGVQQGHHDHLTILVQRYHAPLLRYLFRMGGGNRLPAEDLVQEMFLRLLAGIQHYRYPRPFRPWLYTIAHNLVRDHFKRADTRRTESLPDDEIDRRQTREMGPDTAVLTQETNQQMIAALEQLPLHQKAAILLRYVEDLSLQEISDILHIPVGTVKSRISLGLKQLRKNLEYDD